MGAKPCNGTAVTTCPGARLHVIRDRLPMMHRHGWQGRKASNATAFGWVLVGHAHQGAPTIHRVSARSDARRDPRRAHLRSRHKSRISAAAGPAPFWRRSFPNVRPHRQSQSRRGCGWQIGMVGIPPALLWNCSRLAEAASRGGKPISRRYGLRGRPRVPTAMMRCSLASCGGGHD